LQEIESKNIAKEEEENFDPTKKSQKTQTNKTNEHKSKKERKSLGLQKRIFLMQGSGRHNFLLLSQKSSSRTFLTASSPCPPCRLFLSGACVDAFLILFFFSD
jgi:hypothetical protein